MTNDKNGSRLKILLLIMAGEHFKANDTNHQLAKWRQRRSDREDKSRKTAQICLKTAPLKTLFSHPGKISGSRGILQCYIGNCTSFEDCRQGLEFYLLLSRLQLFSPNLAMAAIIQRHCQEIQIHYGKVAHRKKFMTQMAWH